MPIKIITTEDGSHSLLNEDMNETYHSTRGAKGESRHVFIREGLEYWLSQNKEEEVRILEIGLGTGLNALLTALLANAQNKKVHFTSLEPFPVGREIYEHLHYGQDKGERELFLTIHDSDWETSIALSPFFKLHKSMLPLERFTAQEPFNIVYFDAFAPSKQPEVWSLENLKKCFEILKNGGVLTTYCAQGQFKRNLAEAGFEVETLQGAMGKKEMVRATKIS